MEYLQTIGQQIGSMKFTDFLDVFIAHALTGNLECISQNEQKNDNLKLAIINMNLAKVV